MKKKTVHVLLLCIATLSIISICGGAALSFLVSQPAGTSRTVLAEITENALQNAKQPALRLVPLGDSIDDPVPHTH